MTNGNRKNRIPFLSGMTTDATTVTTTTSVQNEENLKKAGSPETGDENSIGMAMALLLISIGATALIKRRYK